MRQFFMITHVTSKNIVWYMTIYDCGDVKNLNLTLMALIMAKFNQNKIGVVNLC